MLQKIENYKRAFAQLEDAVKSYLATPQDTLYRDGLIQRFEFTVELAWKSLREYLEDQGVVLAVVSPRCDRQPEREAKSLEKLDAHVKLFFRTFNIERGEK